MRSDLNRFLPAKHMKETKKDVIRKKIYCPGMNTNQHESQKNSLKISF